MKLKKILSAVLAAVMLISVNATSSTAAHKVSCEDFSKEELELNDYDIYKYTKPFWEGNIVYNECVFPIHSDTVDMKVYKLMYDATDIISVRSYTMDVTYKEGRDYYLKDGDLYITSTGMIPRLEYTFLHPIENPNNYDYGVFYPHADGEGYEYWTGGTEISKPTLVVSYVHEGNWEHPVPESMESSLPRTMDKLIHKDELTVVVNGDSVSAGALASGSQGLFPFADAYPEMTAKALAEKFGNDKINIVNTAIGGTMSHFDEALLDATVIKHSPDLVIINYGMNDSSCDRVGIPAEEFSANIRGRIEYIQTKLPNCEILLLSSLFGNIYTFPRERYEEHAAALHEIAAEYDGVGVCDPQAIMGSIMDSGKDYVNFMADNMVHPNDYGMRLMAQTILSALDVSDIEGYKQILIEDMTAYAAADSHVSDGKREELEAVIKDAAADIAALEDEWAINTVITAAYDEIDFIVKRCAFEDHLFSHSVVPVTCKDYGYTHSVCSVCGFEYDHDQVAPLGGEHIMDSGRITVSPTYKKPGTYTCTCCRCGFEEHRDVPMLTDAPTLEAEGMLHVIMGYNYMQTTSIRPYTTGTGTVEIDVCPVDISIDGTPYIGVWFSDYSICAAYNFREQQVEIVSNNLPYSALPTVYAARDFEWTPDSGEFEYNWKKFAVKISGNTVGIYIDGILILEDTDPLYRAPEGVALPYSVGEFYLDNFRVVSGDYDPVMGTGEGKSYLWDLNSESSQRAFSKEWGFGSYTDTAIISPTKATVSTGKYYSHSHTATYFATVHPTCSLMGYRDFVCDSCFKVIRLDYKDPYSREGHTLINKKMTVPPTPYSDGIFTYECADCFETFTQVIPANPHGVEYLPGDLNGNGVVDTVDRVYLERLIAGIGIPVEDTRPADMNFDGCVDSADVILVKKAIYAEG